MIVFGIDQSYTSTGLVITRNKQVILSKIIKSDKTLNNFQRIINIKNKLFEYIKEYEPTIINIEGLSFASTGNATRNLAGLQFVIVTSIMEDFPKIKINIVAPQTLKKISVQNGHAKKEELFDKLPNDIKEEYIKYPKTNGRFDLTDAYWLSIFEM